MGRWAAEALPPTSMTGDPTNLVLPGLAATRTLLDTWFSSGLWPIGTLGWPEDTPELHRYFPTSTLVSGFDIDLLLGRPYDDYAAGGDR